MARSLKLGMVVFLGEFVRTGLLVSLLPALVTTRWNLGLDAAAVAISAHYLVDTLMRAPSGWLVDRLGTRRPLVVGLVLGVGALALLLAVGQRVPLYLLTGIYGVSTAPLWPSIVTEATGDRHMSAGGAMGAVFAAWLVGAGLGPVVLNLADHHSLYLAFGLLLSVQGLAAIWAPIVTGHTVRLHRPTTPWRALFQALWRVRPLLPGMFAQTMSLGLFLPIINLFAQRVLGLDPFAYGELLFGAGAVAVILMIPFGHLADRIGIKGPLVFGFALACVAVFFLGQAHSFLTALWLGGLAGLAYAFILPSWNALLASVAPGGAEGSLWGVFMSVEGFGLTVGPVLGARAWTALGPRGPFWAASIVFALMALFYFIYPINRLRRVAVEGAAR